MIITNALPEKRDFDAAVMAVAHKEFLSMDIESLLKPKHVIYDVKAICDRAIIDGRL